MEAILQELHLDRQPLDRQGVALLLRNLTEQLTHAQDELESLQRKHEPSIAEFGMKKAKLKQKVAQLQSDFDSLDLDSMLSLLERRKNDAKTEEAYLDKILSRDLNTEFIAILKAELKALLQSIDPNNNLEQVPASHSGCARLQGASLLVSAGTEKLCSTIHLCCAEVETKVYPEQRENYGAFAEFCQQILVSFSRKLVTKKAQQLPQFMALLANDLAYLIAFVHERFAGVKGSNLALQSLRTLRQQILMDFLSAHKREIREFIASADNAFVAVGELERAAKRISLHLTRLGNVLRPVLLPADFVNILVALLQEAQQQAWKLVFGFAAIGSDEIGPVEQFTKQFLELPVKLFSSDPEIHSIIQACLPLSGKLGGFAQILPLSLVQIINCYHRDEFSGRLSGREIAKIVDSIFAASDLKRELLCELALE